MNFQERVNALIVELHSVGALKFGDFKMKVGINSPVYFDLRVIVSYPKLMAELADLMIQFTESRNVKYDRLCGVPYTALPIATLMAVQSNWPMLMRRKEPKGYGTKKLVEGVFCPGERILIVEDVVTSGSSILETCTDLRNSGLVVTDVVVVVDRQQGGASNLENNGIKIHPLVTLSQVMEILKVAGKVDEEMVKSVNHYTCINQIPVDGQGKFIGKSRMQLTFNERAKLTKCPISKTLFELMEKKKSTLCFAADVTSAQHLIELARAVGPYIVILKTHVDIISDFTKDTAAKLKELAKENNFLIMEDRKFGDIGNTVKLQYSAHCSWADLVTVHALPGNGVFDALRGVFAEVNHEQKGIFVIAQLSSANNLITPNYTKEAVSLVEPYSDVIAGFVCQTSDVIPSPGLIQLTPGVNLSAKTDGLGQQYVRPDVAVLEKGADIVVVGRAIIESKFPEDTAAEIKNILWKVYEDRIRICS